MKQANTSNKQDTREQLIEKYKKENNVQIKANIDREIYGLDKFKQGYAKALEKGKQIVKSHILATYPVNCKSICLEFDEEIDKEKT